MSLEHTEAKNGLKAVSNLGRVCGDKKREKKEEKMHGRCSLGFISFFSNGVCHNSFGKNNIQFLFFCKLFKQGLKQGL